MEQKKKLSFTDDYKKADQLGLTELNRWEDGIDHHEMSERLVRFMADHDYNDYGDNLCLKVGGDGDNGEHLMYLMDSFFEMMDMENLNNIDKHSDNADKESIISDVMVSSIDWDKFANELKDEFGESLVDEDGGDENPHNWWLTDVTVSDIVKFVKNNL